MAFEVNSLAQPSSPVLPSQGAGRASARDARSRVQRERHARRPRRQQPGDLLDDGLHSDRLEASPIGLDRPEGELTQRFQTRVEDDDRTPKTDPPSMRVPRWMECAATVPRCAPGG